MCELKQAKKRQAGHGVPVGGVGEQSGGGIGMTPNARRVLWCLRGFGVLWALRLLGALGGPVEGFGLSLDKPER